MFFVGECEVFLMFFQWILSVNFRNKVAHNTREKILAQVLIKNRSFHGKLLVNEKFSYLKLQSFLFIASGNFLSKLQTNAEREVQPMN